MLVKKSEVKAREKLGSLFCIYFFMSKCSIDGFFNVNSMILIEYGFVIAGSEIREKKEFFLHPLFRFVWVVFLCPDFFIMKMLWSLGQKRWF